MTSSPDWNEVVKASSGDVRRLDHVIRFSSIPVLFQESTSMHSFWVATYAAMIHREVAKNGPFHVLLGEVLLKAIVHDLAECVTGDVVRVFKYSTPELKQEVDRAEEILMKGMPQSLLELVHETEKWGEEDKAYVKDVVKCADFMSLLQFMRREAMRGNLEIYPFFNRMIDDLDAAGLALHGKEHNEILSEKPGDGFRPSDLYTSMLVEAMRIKSLCFPRMER